MQSRGHVSGVDFPRLLEYLLGVIVLHVIVHFTLHILELNNSTHAHTISSRLHK